MNISEIKELIQLINETEITELELETEKTRLVLRKGGVQVELGQNQTIQVNPNPVPHAVGVLNATKTKEPESEEKPDKKGEPVKAPMVGTFYRAPRPGADPFVKVGDRVEVGQTLCIIEAMKLMNEIEAEFTGKIVDILVEDGQPVEYGQTLFIIDPEK
ncbi:acetyl-CoA carboxylase, biotin carboxyl carrier protein [Anoxybacter fermentans]|uniref:Biotin carboxyl carrier protein of acetyl-CoA carboxylase n=1 Tax=Anoxybacter fermentans TaxID=1323375 RepID=A0A3Q9HQX6_9FIRM|nr:acetyl-CoA carboxylase biotin carboxyl carrier protein [Anoxybacter fermentans]AZR73542.1 acetyl-CoA carboxylase, biotin carboxyl carrier protein [Anoxybacter fermentans]